LSVNSFSPAVCPPLAYFSAVREQQVWRYYSRAPFVRQTWRNRYLVPMLEKDVLLTVPVIKCAEGTPFHDVKISYAEDWVRVHLGTLRTAYGKAPFFIHYYEVFAAELQKKHGYLLDLCLPLMEWYASQLGLHIECSDAPIVDEKNYERLSSQGFTYTQVFEPLRSHCQNPCILDLLMNCGKKGIS
jgi:hypothetical protein